jgi:thioredoxin 2
MPPALVRCPACGATNRVAEERLRTGARPVCGRCKAPLPVETGPLTLTDATFAAEVERSPLPLVVDVWAAWCQPCRMLEPVVAELARELTGRVRFAKLNLDENPATAARFGVQSIPTLLVFDRGREIDRLVGVLPKAEIARRLARVVA